MNEKLFEDFQKLHITKEIKNDVLNHPERYINCDIRVKMGRFYTDDEYEKYINKSLNRLLPGKEKEHKLVKRKKLIFM